MPADAPEDARQGDARPRTPRISRVPQKYSITLSVLQTRRGAGARGLRVRHRQGGGKRALRRGALFAVAAPAGAHAGTGDRSAARRDPARVSRNRHQGQAHRRARCARGRQPSRSSWRAWRRVPCGRRDGVRSGGGGARAIPRASIARRSSMRRHTGWRCTCHAGEGDGPQSIHQALHEVGAQRIGHGTRLGRRSRAASRR